VFVDVGLEVPNHVKFPVCFYLFGIISRIVLSLGLGCQIGTWF